MRGRRTRRAPWLALVVLLPLVAASGHTTPVWDEVAGGPGRTGAAFLPSATLDVLWAGELFEGPEMFLARSKGLVSTPHGLLALAYDDALRCRLLQLTPGEEAAARPLEDCVRGRLTGYDRANDRLLMCSIGGAVDPVFQARDAASGEIVWSITPASLHIGAAAGDRADWECQASAVADGHVYVIIGSDNNDVVGDTLAAFVVKAQAQTGELVWVESLAVSDFFHLPVTVGPIEESGVEDSGGFRPDGIALAEGGLVVTGRLSIPTNDPTALSRVDGAVLWLDRESGDVVGGVRGADVRTGDGLRYVPFWATTSGAIAALPLAGSLVQINPQQREPIRFDPFPSVESGVNVAGVIPPVWWGETIAVSVARAVTGIDPRDPSSPWSWTYGNDWTASAMMVVPPRDLFVVMASRENGDAADNTAGVLARLDLVTGTPLQVNALPVPIKVEGNTGRVRFQPLEGGNVLLYDMLGRGVLLGPPEEARQPAISVSATHPAANDAVRVSITDARDDINYTIAWGDGTIETGGTEWSHRYGANGDRTVRVTAAYADGTTATSERVLRVGATPPPELTALQRAFAPENYDLTFGLLGILVTLLAALIAIAARRRRHSRLKDELDALAAIESGARIDAEGAVRALGRYRAHLLDELARHGLDDAQFNTLSARAELVGAAVRTRLLGPVAGRLTDDFRHIVDVALHDGRVEPDELAGIRATLDAERQLTASEKARLVGLFERLAERA